MNVIFKAILVLLAIALIEAKGVRFDEFEPRRPIKYFFHLLELKSSNPQ